MVNWTCDFSQSESRNYFEWMIINIKRLTSASIDYNCSKLIHHAVATCHHYFSCYQNYSLRHGMAHNNTNNALFSLTFAFTDTCNLWQTLQDPGYHVIRCMTWFLSTQIMLKSYCIAYNTCLKIVLQFKSLTEIYYLTIFPRARMGSESIAHEAEVKSD